MNVKSYYKPVKMDSGTDTLRGIIAIVVGIFVIAYPFTKIYTINESIGIGIAFLGVWFLILGYNIRNYSKIESIIYLLLFFIAIITGLFIFENVTLIGYSMHHWLYLTGILILISGTVALFGKEAIEKGAGITGVVLAIIYLLFNFYGTNNYYLALLLGIWLILIGIVQFFISYEESYEFGFFRFFN